jgi:hypothetical protein
MGLFLCMNGPMAPLLVLEYMEVFKGPSGLCQCTCRELLIRYHSCVPDIDPSRYHDHDRAKLPAQRPKFQLGVFCLPGVASLLT